MRWQKHVQGLSFNQGTRKVKVPGLTFNRGELCAVVMVTAAHTITLLSGNVSMMKTKQTVKHGGCDKNAVYARQLSLLKKQNESSSISEAIQHEQGAP